MDEGRTAQPQAGIHVNHWCEHPGCKKWGGYGHAKSKAEKPVWMCWQHFQHKPNQEKHEAAEIAASLGFDR